MEPIENLKKIRLSKLDAIKKAGINPYPAHFERTHTIEQARSDIGQKVTVTGRLRSFREHGKSTFADLVDGSGKIQIYFKEDVVGAEQYAFLKNVDIGDFVGVTGEVFTTHRGEVTITVSSFTLLTKTLRSLPEKWHGLTDVQTRYRKRYLDLLVNENVREVFIRRTRIMSAVREFLDTQGFLEVETPTLQPLYGGANAKPFTTHHNALDFDLYLKISDELYLKRLIVGGFEKVYEIDKDFRNEGIDKTHSPEFTMMECYWAYADYNDMMKLTEDLYSFVANKVLGTTKLTFQGKTVDVKAPWKRITMYQALKIYADIDVEKLSDKELVALLKKHNIEYEGDPAKGVAAGFSRGIAIADLFEIVEPKLIEPVFITDHPKETTALCKQRTDNPDLIERFEPYMFGYEIGNAYSELNDPLVQKQFFEDAVKAKEGGDEEAHPYDTDFIESLEYGMPPTGGLGLGIDRMVMFMTDSATIRDVILFPVMRPEKLEPKVVSTVVKAEKHVKGKLINRNDVLNLVHEHVKNVNLRRHHYAAEAAMRALAKHFGEDEDTWGIVGLIHDADYEETGDDYSKHTLVSSEWLKKLGASQDIINAVLSHNYVHTGNNPPNTKMEWAIYCCDELTGFIVAVTLVRPEKKLSAITVEQVLKKFPQKAFAKNVHREQISMCEEKLGLPLDKFVEIVLNGMKGIDKELGL